jgi:hypothetical protein
MVEKKKFKIADHFPRKVLDEEEPTVNHPRYYNIGKIEVIAAIEDWHLGFHLGNVVKYVARAGHKALTLEDLRKAAWYLDRYIKFLEKGKGNETPSR